MKLLINTNNDDQMKILVPYCESYFYQIFYANENDFNLYFIRADSKYLAFV